MVFVGEAKRGKSSLLNALFSRPGLSPVGSDTTTARFIQFIPQRPDDPFQIIVRYSDGTDRLADPAELGEWVTGPAPAVPDGGQVVSVEVDVPSDRFHGAVLVDTPGAGGLDGGHARLALHAARRAGVLVFITDAGQPLTEPERQFLREAAQTVDDVVVVTKVDKYPTSYQQILDEDRALLRRYAPRFGDAAMIGVSSALALQADGQPQEWATILREQSGIPALTEVLEERIARTGETYVRNALRTASFALAQLGDGLGTHLAAAAQAPGVADRARAERDQLVALREQKASWSMYFERDLRSVRASSIEVLQGERDRLRTEWRQRVDRQKAGFRSAVAEELTAALQADLAAMLDLVGEQFLDGVKRVIAGMLEWDYVSTLLARVEDGPTQEDARPAPAGFKNLFDPGLITTPSLGAGLGFGLASTPAVAALIVVSPVVAGAALLGLTTLYKQVQLARKRQLEWANEEIARACSRATAHLDHVINELKPEDVVAFNALLAARLKGLEAVVREADAAAKNDVTTRRSRISTLETHIAAVEARRAEVDQLLTTSSS